MSIVNRKKSKYILQLIEIIIINFHHYSSRMTFNTEGTPYFTFNSLRSTVYLDLKSSNYVNYTWSITRDESMKYTLEVCLLEELRTKIDT